MNNTPLVSILSPSYNVEKFLPQCLDSIIHQTYSNLQIVLIDDGSEDGTWSVMQEFAAKDKRVEIYHQKNCGVAITRNHLLDKVRGDYVLFVDSDDWIELDMVELLIQKALTTNSSIVTCGMVKNDNSFDKNTQNEVIWEQPEVVLEFLRHVRFNGSLWNKLVATSLFHNVRFHCGISYGEDALFVWGLLQNVDKVVLIDKILYHYRMNDDSISHASWTPEKKGSNHQVWKQITEDVAKLWPQYLDVVKVRAALEDMWALYYVSATSYGYDGHIHMRQQNVRCNLMLILKSDIPTANMKLYAIAASISFSLLKYIHK